MITIAETPLFIKQAAKLFSNEERAMIVEYLALNPLAGDLIPGSGGLRKVRVPASGRGKRGGGRVIYYYHSDIAPLYALAVYAKNTKTDLTRDEIRILAALVDQIKTRITQ